MWPCLSQRVLMCYNSVVQSATPFTGRMIIYDGICLSGIFRSNTADLTNPRHIGHLDIIEL
jgi:hypothetical protein